ncbi:MAG: outer membrane protein assembly factor BamD [Bacteroidetes bacterium]|nr:MAG: outer membrane protein assembly factor BamD [Bacteroidota bacterium]
MHAFSVRHFIYILIAFTAASCSNYQKLIKSGTPIEKFEAAKKYYKDKDYIRALPLFEELLGVYYGKKEREEIYYLYAYSYYGNAEYLLAGYHFNNFTQTYALSSKREEATYMSAVCKFKKSMPHELDQTPTNAAINGLQAFINQYPNSVYVEDCNKKIDELRSNVLEKVYESAKLYYSLGYFKSAIVSCTNALDDYPDMIHRPELSFLIVDAAFQYAENSVTKKQEERYEDTLLKIKYFRKEFGKTGEFAKEIIKIEEKTSTKLAQFK